MLDKSKGKRQQQQQQIQQVPSIMQQASNSSFPTKTNQTDQEDEEKKRIVSNIHTSTTANNNPTSQVSLVVSGINSQNTSGSGGGGGGAPFSSVQNNQNAVNIPPVSKKSGKNSFSSIQQQQQQQISSSSQQQQVQLSQQQQQQQQQQQPQNIQQQQQQLYSQYTQSPYLTVQLPPLYLNSNIPNISQKSTAATPQTNTSAALQFPSPALISSTNNHQNTVKSITQGDQIPLNSLFKTVSQTPLLISQSSQLNGHPFQSLVSPQHHSKERIQQKGNIITEFNQQGLKKNTKSRNLEEQTVDSPSTTAMISLVGRSSSAVNSSNYLGGTPLISNKAPQKSPLTPNFISNSQLETDLLSKKAPKSNKIYSHSKNLSNQPQQTLGSSNSGQGLIEMALKNKSKSRKSSHNKFLDEKIQEDQRTLESRQSDVVNYENQESVAQFMPSLIGKKTPFSNQKKQMEQQLSALMLPGQVLMHQPRIVLHNPQQQQVKLQQQAYTHIANNSVHESLQQSQQQSNQLSQFQSIIPNYFESQQQLKEVNLLTSSISSNSSGQLPYPGAQTSISKKKRNNKTIQSKFNPNMIALAQNSTLKQQSTKIDSKNALNQQKYYQNSLQQTISYKPNRRSKSQDSYQYFLENQDNKAEVKEEDEEDDEEEEEEEEEEDDEEEDHNEYNVQNKMNEHFNKDLASHNLFKQQNIWVNQHGNRGNNQQGNGQIKQNFQSVEEQSESNNMDEQFQDGNQNAMLHYQGNTQQYDNFQYGNYYQQRKDFNVDVNQNDIDVYEISESEDDEIHQQNGDEGIYIQDYDQDEDDEESEEEDNDSEEDDENDNEDDDEDQEFSEIDEQRNGISTLEGNKNLYKSNRINTSGKNNISTEKIHSLSQVNTSNFDQMRSLVSPENRNLLVLQQYPLKLGKNSSTKIQLRSNASLDKDNNQLEYDDIDGEESHLTSFPQRKASKSHANYNSISNNNTSNSKSKSKLNQANSLPKVKKKSNTISSNQNYSNEVEQSEEGLGLIMNVLAAKNASTPSSQQNQNNPNYNLPSGSSINSKSKKKNANNQAKHQVLYQNFNQQEGYPLGEDSFYQTNKVGNIIFAKQQQQVKFNNCNQYKFNIQNVNIQPGSGNVMEQIENSMILYKKNNNMSDTQLGGLVNTINQSDIPLQHHIKGLDQISIRETNNSIIEKQVPEPPPPAQYSKYDLSSANNIAAYPHKTSFSSSASKTINNPSAKNLEVNNNGKRGSFLYPQSVPSNQLIDAKQKVKLMHFSSIDATPQGSQFGNTPQRGMMNNFNNFTISPRLYGNDQINNTNITQSILFASPQPQQQQYLNQLKRDQMFYEDQQENLKSYLVNKQKEKQQLKKKHSDDATSITNHLTSNSPNNNNNSNNAANNQFTQKISSVNKKNKEDNHKINSLKICMSTVLLDQDDDQQKNTKQRVYSQQPYLEDPQIKKKWVLSRVAKMQIDHKLANQLIEDISLYCHTKEVILEKLIQSIFSYQTLNLKLRKKDPNEVSVVQAAKNRTTQIIRSVSQLFTSTSNSNPSQQEIQQKKMQRMTNNANQTVATTANNRTTTNDNQATSEQEDYTQYEKDYIHENIYFAEKVEAKNQHSMTQYKDMIQTTMATTSAAGQVSGYNNMSHNHNLSQLGNASSFSNKKANHFKNISNNGDKNNSINTTASTNNIQNVSHTALKTMSNGSYINVHHTRPHSVNLYSENTLPGNTMNGTSSSSSNIQLVQQSQQASIFSAQAKDKKKKHQKKSSDQAMYELAQKKQQILLAAEQDGQKTKIGSGGNLIVLQQVNNEQFRKNENSKFRRGNSKQQMDLSSISVSNDLMGSFVPAKIGGNFKNLMQSQAIAKDRQRSIDYRQIPLSQSNNMSPQLPSHMKQSSQINQREQSFSFNYQNRCPICQHEAETLCELSHRCGHKFCLYCIRQYIEHKIYSNDIVKIRCPFKGCKYRLRSENFKPYISEELFQKYKAFKKLIFRRKNPNLRYCTRPSCDGYMVGDEEHPKLTCPKCSQEVCYHCCNNWHQGLRCDQAIEQETQEIVIKDTGKQSCPNCRYKLSIFKQIDGVQYSNKIMCSACNKPFCNLCRRECGQFHFAPWNICYGCPGQKYSLEEPQCCEKFCIFLWGVMKLMLYAFLSMIALAIYPFIVAVVSLFMPLIIYAYFKGNRLQYNGCKKYMLLFSLFLLGIILYPIWLLIAFIPGTCLFFKDMYLEKKLYADEIDQSQAIP